MFYLLVQLYITHWFAFDMLRNIIFSNYFKKIIVQFCELFIFVSKLLKFFACLTIASCLKFVFHVINFRSQIALFFGWIVIIVVYSLPQTFNFLWIFPFFFLKIEPSLHEHCGVPARNPNFFSIATFLYLCLHLFILVTEWYRLPLASTDRSFVCEAFSNIIFPTFGEGKLRKLSFLQCIFTPSKVPALKMAGNVVWALYNTAASAEYKSVPFIWFFKEQFFGHCGSFCFYHSKNFN